MDFTQLVIRKGKINTECCHSRALTYFFDLACLVSHSNVMSMFTCEGQQLSTKPHTTAVA
jgi:hypothetical protein